MQFRRHFLVLNSSRPSRHRDVFHRANHVAVAQRLTDIVIIFVSVNTQLWVSLSLVLSMRLWDQHFNYASLIFNILRTFTHSAFENYTDFHPHSISLPFALRSHLRLLLFISQVQQFNPSNYIPSIPALPRLRAIIQANSFAILFAFLLSLSRRFLPSFNLSLTYRSCWELIHIWNVQTVVGHAPLSTSKFPCFVVLTMWSPLFIFTAHNAGLSYVSHNFPAILIHDPFSSDAALICLIWTLFPPIDCLYGFISSTVCCRHIRPSDYDWPPYYSWNMFAVVSIRLDISTNSDNDSHRYTVYQLLFRQC